MLLDAAFTVLLLLVSGGSSGFVPPPTNVTVSCENLKVTVSWDYKSEEPHTVFRVSISRSGSSGSFEDETTDHHYDLSRFVWQSERHYLAFLYVTIAAVQEGVQSKPVNSNTFSFNNLKTVDIKCALDFPPVRVTAMEKMSASVMFPNPLKVYSQLTHASKLKFTVSAAGMDFTKLCRMQNHTCKVDVTFPEGEKKCVRLTGWLFDHGDLTPVLLRHAGPICSTETADLKEEWLALILVLISVLVIVGLVFVIYKTKAWTMKPPSLPQSLLPQPDLKAHHPEDKITISPVSVTIPSKSPSIRSDHKYSENSQLSSTSSGSDRLLYGDAGQLEDNLTSKGNGTGEDSAADSMKTDSGSVCSQDEGELLFSPYDSPQFLELDLGDGDMVTGYKERKPEL